LGQILGKSAMPRVLGNSPKTLAMTDFSFHALMNFKQAETTTLPAGPVLEND
jgi:hypothetical protein